VVNEHIDAHSSKNTKHNHGSCDPHYAHVAFFSVRFILVRHRVLRELRLNCEAAVLWISEPTDGRLYLWLRAGGRLEFGAGVVKLNFDVLLCHSEHLRDLDRRFAPCNPGQCFGLAIAANGDLWPPCIGQGQSSFDSCFERLKINRFGDIVIRP
jgi:hypothetical protein